MVYVPRGPGGGVDGNGPAGAGSSSFAVRESAYRESAPAAGNHAAVTFDPVAVGRRWLVQRIALFTTSSTPSFAYIYDAVDAERGGIARNLLGISYYGNRDDDGTSAPYVIEAGKQLFITWVGVSDDAIATARIQYVQENA